MGVTNLTPLPPRVGEGQIFKFLTNSQIGPKRGPIFSETVRHTGLLFAPWDTSIARISPMDIHFSTLSLGAVRGAPKVDQKF